MHNDFARYDDLVHRIYDAGLEPAHWPEAIVAIADFCDSPRSAMFTPMHGTTNGGFAFMPTMPAFVLAHWASPRGREDPYAKVSLERGLFSDGVTQIGTELVSYDALVETDLYRNILAPIDVGQICSTVIFDSVDAHKMPTILTLYRSERDPLFDQRQVAILRRLNLHISRALGVMFHLRDGAFQVAASHAALDHLAAGVLLLDGRGTVQFCNRAALVHLRAQQTVVLKSRYGTGDRLSLVPRLHAYEGHFQKTLFDAVSPLTVATPDHFSNALLLPGPDGSPSCVLHVAPLGQSFALGAGVSTPRAIVFLYDLEAASRVPAGLLTELYGLTPAEARAALQMLRGGSAEDMAQRLGVSPHTFKSQLKVVYAKSGAHRQADLLKVLLALSVA